MIDLSLELSENVTVDDITLQCAYSVAAQAFIQLPLALVYDDILGCNTGVVDSFITLDPPDFAVYHHNNVYTPVWLSGWGNHVSHIS